MFMMHCEVVKEAIEFYVQNVPFMENTIHEFKTPKVHFLLHISTEKDLLRGADYCCIS